MVYKGIIMENALWGEQRLVACEVAEDYETEKKIRMASYRGELRCPDEGCCSPILKYCHGEIREPYFAHRDNGECDYVRFEKSAGVFHGLRVLLYEHFKACDYPVQMEKKVLPHHYSHLYFEWEDGRKTALEIGTKNTNINDVIRLQEAYTEAGIQVVWLVADQPGKIISEEHTYFMKRFCLNESGKKDLIVIGYDGKHITQYREDPNAYFIDGQEMLSENYPKLFSYEAYLSDLYFEDGMLTTRGFEAEYNRFYEEKQLAFAVYKEQIEEEKEYLRRQYEVLRKGREIKDTRIFAESDFGEDYESRRQSILAVIDQQESPVLDSLGNRWVRCEFCGEVKEVSEFVSFGGRGRVNLGRCQECKEN